VGSGLNLSSRLRHYYSLTYMQGVLKRSRSIIFSAILKQGLESFSLTILEYCLEEELLEREDYYITTLKPEYNILQKAGSSLGFKHTEETIIKMSLAKKGKKSSFLGKIQDEEVKTKISEIKGTPIKVLDLETNATSTHFSIRKAAEILGVTHKALTYHFKKTDSFVFKDRYLVEKVKI